MAVDFSLSVFGGFIKVSAHQVEERKRERETLLSFTLTNRMPEGSLCVLLSIVF